MASLSESPAMRQARETAFRDKSLLNKQYRQARASGDFGRAMTVAQQADKMGMPVGVSGSFDQLAQTGQRRYEQSMFAAGQQPEKTGLAGFDFRQASQRGAVGVGGYDFRQKAQQQPMQPAQDMAPQAPSSQRVPPVALSTTVPGSAPSAPANPRAGLREQFTKMYQEAGDDTAKSDIVAEAYAQGVPLSGLGMDILRKSQAGILAQPPKQQSERLTFTNTAGQPVMTDAGRQYYENAKQQYEAKPETVVMRQKEEQQRRLQLLDRDLSAKRKAEDRWASRVQFGKEQKAFSENYDKETDAQMRKYDAEIANLESGQFESAAAMQTAANVEKAEDEAYYSTLAGRNESLMLGRMPQRTQGFADAMRKRNAATIKTRNEWRPKPRPTVNWRDSTPYAPPLR
jgi:hypothetical protein